MCSPAYALVIRILLALPGCSTNSAVRKNVGDFVSEEIRNNWFSGCVDTLQFPTSLPEISYFV
jgi:hypothetical protein